MSFTLRSLSERSRYRIASVALLATAYGWLFVVRLLGYSEWLSGIVGIPLYTILIYITYWRLRDAALSGGWIGLMILTLNFGPEWFGFHITILINLLPVALAWIARSKSEVNPQTA